MRALFISLLAFTILLGNEGYDVYKKNCQMCHVELLSKAQTKKRFNTLKAPPMVEVSKRLKENIIIADDDDDVKRRVVIAFIKEYIEHPNVEYSMCHAMAIEHFGIMPSLQGKLTAKQKEAVATWIYDRYEDVSF